MTLHLHTLSGSPFGWKVQLALEHKGLAYTIDHLSPERGETQTPAFRAISPHGKLPVLIDDDFVLFESDAIVEYLEDAYPAFGPSLWQRGAEARAVARRIVIETSSYLYPPMRQLVLAWPGLDETTDQTVIDVATQAVASQLTAFAEVLSEPFFTGQSAGAADYAVYPLVALTKRLHGRRPDRELVSHIPAALALWAGRIERLSYFANTYPPHWKA